MPLGTLSPCISNATLMQCTEAKYYVLKMASLNSAALARDTGTGPIAGANGSSFS
jgi:hypothetical protein